MPKEVIPRTLLRWGFLFSTLSHNQLKNTKTDTVSVLAECAFCLLCLLKVAYAKDYRPINTLYQRENDVFFIKNSTFNFRLICEWCLSGMIITRFLSALSMVLRYFNDVCADCILFVYLTVINRQYQLEKRIGFLWFKQNRYNQLVTNSTSLRFIRIDS